MHHVRCTYKKLLYLLPGIKNLISWLVVTSPVIKACSSKPEAVSLSLTSLFLPLVKINQNKWRRIGWDCWKWARTSSARGQLWLPLSTCGLQQDDDWVRTPTNVVFSLWATRIRSWTILLLKLYGSCGYTLKIHQTNKRATTEPGKYWTAAPSHAII